MDRNPTDLPARLQPGQRLLGLDPGEKNVGVAISDPGFTLASPLTTLKRGQLKKLATELAAIVAAEGIGGIVVGLALNMDGSDGPKAQAARQLARNLERVLNVPVALWDERLSTAAVTRTLLEADASRKKRAEVVDRMAAAYILQGALDRIQASRRP
jgi:putative Holliday junction resolvase